MADRVILEVLAGVIPEKPEEEFSRRWTITSDEWEACAHQTTLLAEYVAKAEVYAHLLGLQPDRFNWVQINWIWL